MTLRHISPRSIEWYEAILEDEEPLPAEDVLALRTMKALEDASIRAALSRIPRHRPEPSATTLHYRLSHFQAGSA